MRTGEYAFGRLAASILLLCALPALSRAFTWPWDADCGWPATSSEIVLPLDRPSVEDWFSGRGMDPGRGYSFGAMGDQRALADGEWQAILERLRDVARREERFAFLVDTGDIVRDGRHTDQFTRLRNLLAGGPDVPYLVGVGNHEVHDNESFSARSATARFLSSVDPAISESRLYYRKVIGPVRFLFLDTNDLAYGDDGSGPAGDIPEPGSRAEAQMQWLASELAEPAEEGRTTVVVMHHPFVASSEKHRAQGRGLWSYRYGGRTLPDILADGGVDLILTGHTHTYERFRLRRSDGRAMALVNLSGRPRDSFLWFGSHERRARDIRGREKPWLAARGWADLDRWEIRQESVMLDPGSNQFAVFRVGADGSIEMEVFFLDPEKVGTAVGRQTVRIR